jgi:hypothetical protein
MGPFSLHARINRINYSMYAWPCAHKEYSASRVFKQMHGVTFQWHRLHPHVYGLVAAIPPLV